MQHIAELWLRIGGEKAVGGDYPAVRDVPGQPGHHDRRRYVGDQPQCNRGAAARAAAGGHHELTPKVVEWPKPPQKFRVAIDGGRPPLDRILHVEPIGEDLFEAHSYTDASRLYGGQAIAQALLAAGRTVDTDRHVHSLHAQFLRPGNTADPIIYRVDRPRDGRSFTTRNVAAEQNGKTIFELSASFQRLRTACLINPNRRPRLHPKTYPT